MLGHLFYYRQLGLDPHRSKHRTARRLGLLTQADRLLRAVQTALQGVRIVKPTGRGGRTA